MPIVGSFRNKLARLPVAAPAEASPAPERSQLDDLRERMNAILQRPVEPAPPRVRHALPFATEETSAGPVHVKRTVYGISHRVGVSEIAPSAESSSELLALLALDPALGRCDPRQALYFDTETTGLSGGTGTVAFLLGLGFWAPEGFVVEQYFLPELGGEAPILVRYLERMQNASMLVSFNGKSFDAPLLRTRLTMARLGAPPPLPHLDLLHVARRVHKEWMPGGGGDGPRSFRLGALERDILGLERVGDVPSSEVSACYLHFLRTGDEDVLRAVIDHNAWDVVSMAALLGLYGEPLHRTRIPERDLPGVAHTLRRAGSLESALEIADRAVAAAGTPDAYWVRGEMARARGDRDRALADFETLSRTVDSERVRLSLAKLYEHHVKDYDAALRVSVQGTGEDPARLERRRTRLRRKAGEGTLMLPLAAPVADATARPKRG